MRTTFLLVLCWLGLTLNNTTCSASSFFPDVKVGDTFTGTFSLDPTLAGTAVRIGNPVFAIRAAPLVRIQEERPMRTNIHATNPLRTHEGAQAHPINAEQALRRSVLSCLLFEKEF
jgi:hypothetical protein